MMIRQRNGRRSSQPVLSGRRTAEGQSGMTCQGDENSSALRFLRHSRLAIEDQRSASLREES